MTRHYVPAALRRTVHARARARCEYCLLDEDDTPFSHHYEHIIPVRHGGKTQSDNLALACLECNLAKGTDLTAFDPENNAITRLFNPRTDAWGEHFAFDGAKIIGLTPAGRATANFLRFNDPLRVIQRQAILDIG